MDASPHQAGKGLHLRVVRLFLVAGVFGCSLAGVLCAQEPTLEEWSAVLGDATAHTLSRMEAARRLGEAGDVRALETLTEALADDNKAVRWAALEALWQLNSREALPWLVAYLEKEEAYTWGKLLTMNALGSLGDPRAVEPLLKMIGSENPFLRRSAALNLFRIGDDRALAGLIELLRDEEKWLARFAQDLLLALTRADMQGDPPREYEEWMEWLQNTGKTTEMGEVRQP